MKKLLVLSLVCLSLMAAGFVQASALKVDTSSLLDSGGNRVLLGLTDSDARWAPVLGYQVVRVNDVSKQLSLGVGPYVTVVNGEKTDRWSGGPMLSLGVNRLWAGVGLDVKHKVRAQFAVGLSLKF